MTCAGPPRLPRRVAMLSRAHLAARPAGHRRRRRHERLRRRAGQAAGRRWASRSRSSPGPPRGDLPPVVELAPGVIVRHVTAGPFEGLAKDDLPGQLCAFTAGVLRAEAMHEPGYYDLVHSHYWLSGQVGWLAKERWGVPLVHTMHTMAKVKNAALAEGDTPEPPARVIGEEQVVEAADRLVANTDDEARELVDLYGADPRPGRGRHPGRRPRASSAPATGRGRARRLGLPADARRAAVRRPDPAAQGARRAAARGRRGCSSATRRCATRLVVAVVGGPVGTGPGAPRAPRRAGRARSAIADVVRFVPPVPQRRARRLVPRRRRRRRAVVQRVVRPGRPGGAGLRHAGRRGRRRRPAHGGRATGVRACSSTGTTRDDWADVLGACSRPSRGRASALAARRRRARRSGSAGRRPRRDCSTVYAEALAERAPRRRRRGR